MVLEGFDGQPILSLVNFLIVFTCSLVISLLVCLLLLYFIAKSYHATFLFLCVLHFPQFLISLDHGLSCFNAVYVCFDLYYQHQLWFFWISQNKYHVEFLCLHPASHTALNHVSIFYFCALSPSVFRHFVFIQLKIWKCFLERHPTQVCKSKIVFNKMHLPKKPLDKINKQSCRVPGWLTTIWHFTKQSQRTHSHSHKSWERKVTFLPLCSLRMQACVIFLPSCPRAQGDCTSPELSHAIGIKVSLTGTPQGQRETAACFGANRWRRRWKLQMGHAGRWWKWLSLASSSVMRAPSLLCSFIRERRWNKERMCFGTVIF